MNVTEVTAAFLVQPLEGQPTQERPWSRDHARAGRISVGYALVASATRHKWQEEDHTCDLRAPAAARRPCSMPPISEARVVWTDDGGGVGLTRRATTQGGHAKGGP